MNSKNLLHTILRMQSKALASGVSILYVKWQWHWETFMKGWRTPCIPYLHQPSKQDFRPHDHSLITLYVNSGMWGTDYIVRMEWFTEGNPWELAFCKPRCHWDEETRQQHCLLARYDSSNKQLPKKIAFDATKMAHPNRQSPSSSLHHPNGHFNRCVLTILTLIHTITW